MDIANIRQQLEDLPDVIFTLEESYLTAKAQLEYMQDLTKHLLAKWKGLETGPNTEKERLALAREEYYLHINGMYDQAQIVARKAAEFHREERRFEALRSLNKNV